MRGLITLVAALSSVFTVNAMAQSNNNNEPPAKKPNNIESVEITEQPKSPGWSQDRMKKAKPLPMPKADSDKAK